MKTLGASIVQRGIASVRDVEEALARQVMYGGDLATNLLESAKVSEPQLTELLAAAHNLDPAPAGELPVSATAVRRLVPGDLALRHGLYPLSEEDGKLKVAVAEPLASEVEQDLSFALGLTIVQLAAPLVRIHQAIARDYKQPLDGRTQRILAKLSGRRSVIPSAVDSRPRIDFANLPRPDTLPPGAYAQVFDPDTDVPTAPPPLDYSPGASAATPHQPPAAAAEPIERAERDEAAQKRASAAAGAPAPATAKQTPSTQRIPSSSVPPKKPARRKKSSQESAPRSRDTEPSATRRSVHPVDLGKTAAELKRSAASRPRRLGPYTAADAERDLMAAEERDDALVAFFDFASQYFEYCALFVLHGDLAEGRDARGPGASSETVRRIGIPLDLPSAIAGVYNNKKWALVRLTGGGIDGGLAKDLGRRAGPQVLILPIVMRNRCVLILYGDHGDQDVQLSTIGDVISFTPLVATAFENLILRRKRAAKLPSGPSASIAPMPHPGHKHSRPSREQRAQALAGVLDAEGAPPSRTGAKPAVQAPKADAPPPVPRTQISRREPAASERGEPSPAAEARPASVKPDLGSKPDDGSKHEQPRPPSLVGARVLSIEPPRDVQSDGSDRPSQPPIPLTRRAGTQRARKISEPPEDGWDVESAPKGPDSVDQRESLSPQIAIEDGEVDQDVEDALVREQEAPLAPASRSLAHSARPLGKPGSAKEELQLPTVIVDATEDCSLLVHQLCAGDLSVIDRLVDYGATAITLLVAAFPGPITGELRRGGDSPPRASECGPVLRALVRLGIDGVPFLVVRTADAQPHVRMWATRLLGELPARDSGLAVAKRLVDGDAEVRRGALAAARMLQSSEAARTALREWVVGLATDPGRPSDQRHAAIEALTDIRDPAAVPAFIDLLQDEDRELAKSAHWGLAVLTRTDLGADQQAWHKWWAKNGSKHRVEWLIDALMHDNSDIRKAAGDELKNVTKEYFGYYDDLPKKERSAAQARYRDWWAARGQRLFH